MSRASFLKAERARRGRLAVTLEQRRELQKLALKAGVEMPRVYSMAEAADALEHLKAMTGHQPTLEGFATLGPMG